MFSKDQRLIIKSVRKSEFPFLVRILMGYHEHIEANTFHSLLPRYLGLYVGADHLEDTAPIS